MHQVHVTGDHTHKAQTIKKHHYMLKEKQPKSFESKWRKSR